MIIKVISGNVIHGGNSLGVGSVINDIDKENAERLCKCGLCEIIDGGNPVNEDIDEAELQTEEKSLEEMTKAELLQYAESIGVEVNNRDTKEKIIKSITDADIPDTGFPQ